MATEFEMILEDRPGTLARIGGALGDAGVNIEAIQGMRHEGKNVVRFVPRDPEKAVGVLETARIPFYKREVLIVRVLDEPGTLGQVALVMAEAGINIDSVYVTVQGHVVLGVDDLRGAIQVAGGMAVLEFD
jgi:hypothetical protein